MENPYRDLEQEDKDNKPKYGVFIGRFEPFHKGHEYTPRKIQEDGLIPVILVGSAQESGTEKNPLSYAERRDIISTVFPVSIIAPIVDSYSNTLWMSGVEQVLATISSNKEDFVFYFHDKPEDTYDIVYKEETYANCSYSKIFEVEGYKVVKVPLSDIPISGTAIRSKLESNEQYVQPQVYKRLKELGW